MASGAFPNVPQSFGLAGALATPAMAVDAATPTGARPSPTLGTSPPARKPKLRATADIPPVVQPMSNAELTTVLQQVTAQMAADHLWFGTLSEDITDHAQRLDKLTMVSTTNQVELQSTKAEAVKAFTLIDFNDDALKRVMTAHNDKTSEHAGLLQQVDTALRAQVQAEVSRLDVLVAELQANAAGGGMAQALAGLTNLQEQVWALTVNTTGHLGDLKAEVTNLQVAGADLTNHTRGFEAALVARVEHIAQAQQSQAATGGTAAAAPTYAYPTSQQAQAPGGSADQDRAPNQTNTGAPVFPPVRGRLTAYQPAGPAAAPSTDARSTGFLGPNGLWGGQSSQPTPQHHSLSPGRGDNSPPEGAGRRVIFDQKGGTEPALPVRQQQRGEV